MRFHRRFAALPGHEAVGQHFLAPPVRFNPGCAESFGRCGNSALAGILRVVYDGPVLGRSDLCSSRDFARLRVAHADREVLSPRSGDHLALDWSSFDLRWRGIRHAWPRAHPPINKRSARSCDIRNCLRGEPTMKQAYAWSAIAAIVLSSTTGDVLLS